jgi:hypothetical protein
MYSYIHIHMHQPNLNPCHLWTDCINKPVVKYAHMYDMETSYNTNIMNLFWLWMFINHSFIFTGKYPQLRGHSCIEAAFTWVTVCMSHYCTSCIHASHLAEHLQLWYHRQWPPFVSAPIPIQTHCCGSCEGSPQAVCFASGPATVKESLCSVTVTVTQPFNVLYKRFHKIQQPSSCW